MLENQWEKRLNFTDKYVINFIMNPRLKHYGYDYKKAGILGALTVPFLILLPLFEERRFLTPGYIRNRFRIKRGMDLVRNFLNYLKRVRVCFKAYGKVIRRVGFNQPLLIGKTSISPDDASEQR